MKAQREMPCTGLSQEHIPKASQLRGVLQRPWSSGKHKYEPPGDTSPQQNGQSPGPRTQRAGEDVSHGTHTPMGVEMGAATKAKGKDGL